MKEECFFSTKNRFHLLQLHLYQIGKAQNIPMVTGQLVVTSTNRGFCTLQHAVATYEQTKMGLSNIYPKRNVQQDGILTRPLNINL